MIRLFYRAQCRCFARAVSGQDTDPLNINLKPSLDPPITYIGAPIHRRWLKRDSDLCRRFESLFQVLISEILINVLTPRNNLSTSYRVIPLSPQPLS